MAGTKLNYPLAVFAPYIGKRSETFIKRHMTDLLPGKTVLVFGRAVEDYSMDWEVDAPVFSLSKYRPGLLSSAYHTLLDKLKLTTFPRYHRALKAFLKTHNVQAILCEYLDYSTGWVRLAQELDIRLYAHAHGYDVSICLKNPDMVEKYKRLNDAERIITMSQVSKNNLVDFGIRESKVVVIPYGVDIPENEPNYKGNRTIRCLAVGRMTGKKAPIYLLEAFRKSLMKYPDLTLHYIGDGELMPAVIQYVDSLKLKDKVQLLGSQPSRVVIDLMSDADIFLQHSIVNPVNGDEEGLPVAILEAMANGLPVVATAHSGIPEAIEDNVNGFLVKEGMIDDMADRIVMLANDARLRQEFGLKGKEKAATRFSWPLERSKLLNLMNLAS